MAAVLNLSTDMSSTEPCNRPAELYFDTLSEIVSIDPGLAAHVHYTHPRAALPGTEEAQFLKLLLDALAADVPYDQWGEE